MYLFTAIGLSPGDSGYFTCKQDMKLVTTIWNSIAYNGLSRQWKLEDEFGVMTKNKR